MPGPWKPHNEYSQSHLNKLKRQCIRNTDSDGESSQQDDSDQVEEMSDNSEHLLEPDEVHCESSNASDLPISDDNGMEQAETVSNSDSDESHVNEVNADISTDSEPDYYFEHSDDEEGYEHFIRDQNPEDEPLYEGASINVAESSVAILDFALRHKATGSMLSDLLSLVELHCPAGNKCKKTLFTFKKYFAKSKFPLVRHFVCKRCFQRVEGQASLCPTCEDESKIGYFMEVPIIPQIRSLYKRPGFHAMLQHKFTRVRENIDHVEDIYDGEVYKELSQVGGYLAKRNNISLMFYTDGISIFKSSKFCLWPVYLIINELPYSLRTKKENILLVAIWFGDEKPVPNLYLAPLLASLREIREGIEVHIPNAQAPLIVQGMIICATCDLPAKALFLNMKQYNGKFGCQKCKQKGTYLTEEKVLVYPYEEFTLRTNDETLDQAQIAFNTGIAVCGVKGPTIFRSLVYNYMRAVAVDEMHCVYEGVVASIMNFLFSPRFYDHPASVIQHIDLVDERIRGLTPPSSVQRLPREIAKHLAFFKAHERKSWFHYWSIPCLQDIMEQKYFNHYKLLVLGITILNGSSVSEIDLNIASRALNEFVSMFQELYHLPNMSNNVHQLLHLVENVRQFGPLWATSCFPLEDLNGKLKSLVHGSNSPQLQIHSSISMFLSLTTLKSESLVEGRPAHLFCEKLDYKWGRLQRHLVSDTTYIIGKSKKMVELPPPINEIFQESDIQGTTYFQYLRLLKKKTLFASTGYKRSKRTDSTFALFSGEDGLKQIGRIKSFIRVSNCACNAFCNCIAHNYAIVKPCILENRFSTCIDSTVLSTVHNIVDFQDTELAVNIERLKSVCFYTEIEHPPGRFVIEPVNSS